MMKTQDQIWWRFSLKPELFFPGPFGYNLSLQSPNVNPLGRDAVGVSSTYLAALTSISAADAFVSKGACHVGDF
jgi:hypothetical protein